MNHVNSRLLVTLALAGLLAACGGSDDPADPLAHYKTQTVAWGDCRAYLQDGPDSDLDIFGDRLQCARVQVPQNYDRPEGPPLSISLMRVRAVENPQDKPHLFFNPGGPGGDGLSYGAVFARTLSEGSPQTEVGRTYLQAAAAYNFVGFSPRGVGDSSNLRCSGNQLVYNARHSQWGSDAANIAKITDKARYIAQDCQKNPIAADLHTDATARDMDLMRQLLGDEKLHYYGISYGTWLGIWYAGLFPERVGPMLLDSNMDFTRSIHDASIGSVQGQILTFNDFIAPWAARHDDLLSLGVSADAVKASVARIGPEVAEALIELRFVNRAEADKLPRYLAALRSGVQAQRLLDAGRAPAELDAALKSEPPLPHARFDTLYRGVSEVLAATVVRQQAPGYDEGSKPLALDNDDSVWNAVVCNDEALPYKTPDYWVQAGFALARQLPFVSIDIASQPCLDWKERERYTKPDLARLKDVPLMMLQSAYDVPTPTVGAQRTFEQLSAAHMVHIANEGGHGLMFYGTDCVELAVWGYLLGQPPAARETTCAGKPLPLEESTRGQQKTAPAPASNFADPALAERLIREMRRALGESAGATDLNNTPW